MGQEHQRVITFDNIQNFRDLGGYKGRGGSAIAWRRLYRSGDPTEMSARDKDILGSEIKLKTVIDLSSPDQVKKSKEIRLLEDIGAAYFNIAFRPDEPNYYEKELKLYQKTLNMGYFYLGRIGHESFGRKLMQALEIIADPQYHPVLFHCGAGKDRTGVLAAIVLKLLGVSDADVVGDYLFTEAAMVEIRNRVVSNPATTDEVKNLPDFHWWAKPEYMQTFLDGLQENNGGAAGYLKKYGAEKTLVKRLEKALLI
jgi:protein-tyrosine phosphatase